MTVHLFPLYRHPGEYPPGRIRLETKWMLCEGHEFLEARDYFHRDLEACRHCKMPRYARSNLDGLCTHVEYELTVWGVEFMGVTHVA